MNKGLLLAACCFFFWCSLSAQPYYFRRYLVENGLSNNAVICSIQDKKGFLWFGTKDGLNRFDGYTFKVFRNNPDEKGSLGSNFIHSLYEDRNGKIWVGTERGLYKYDESTESFQLVEPTAHGHIREIMMDQSGNLWFIEEFTLYKYNEAKRKLEDYNQNQYFEATSLCTTPDGTLWVSTSNGLLKKYNPAKNSFTSYDLFDHSQPVVAQWIEKIHASNGSIFIGTSNQGAKIFDPKTFTYQDILTYNTDRTAIFVRDFAQTAKDEFWIATESGIFIYNLTTGKAENLQKKYNDPFSISDNAIYTFCKDKEGGVWVGTYFGGISYYRKQYTTFKKYFPMTGENSLSGNVVREIRQDQSGNLWIGTEDAGLNKLDATTGQFIHFLPKGNKESISYTNIHGLLINNDELWIGTFEHGLDILNIKSGKVVRHYEMGQGPNSLKSNFIYTIYQTTEGDIMLGTTRGAFVYNRASDDFTPLHGMPQNNWYSALLKDSKDVVWAGTYGNGVNFYNTATNESGNFKYDIKDKYSLSSDRVNAIYEASDKTLWFATENGLCLFNREQNNFKRYSTLNGLPSNFILCVLEDELKNLWISTSKGLVSFNPKTEKFIIYTRTNGLLSDQFNFNSAFKDKNGTMYFGSGRGLISFQPNQFIQNTFIPPVYITGFQLNNQELAIAQNGSPLHKSITYTEKITLEHNQSTFSIDFAALSFTAPEMTEYAYKMEGLEKDWTYLKRNRKVYFTELAPGNYVFKVKASNNSGIWNDQETKLLIQILPPWWMSSWAYGLYFLLGIIGFYILIISYHKKVEEKNKRKFELLETEKEKEILNAKIEFFTNVAHEIKTPLTLIKGPLEKVIQKAGDIIEIKNSLKIMERNTERLIELTNQLLDFRQTEIQGFRLNFEKANISEVLADHFCNFKTLAEQKNLDYQLEMPKEVLIASIDTEAFQKILSNIFSNAVKYAENKVLVRLLPFNQQDQFFTIEVSNDGYLIPAEMKEKIFEPFIRLRETEKQKGTGIGLALAQSLVQLHKGVLELKDSQNNMNVFALKLPMQQENEFDMKSNNEKTLITSAKEN
ncbi:ATP-binding protein [Chitinophagaceae bacterium LB-8]|uniref:histidine kinase n=1 Tax=Paraflavisolibacter caeni TaxID=2982496 RepID=A0A9X2XUJ0_9BACT|nr:two-component regulator propeller domain-containing protein [Paraflavisolibacter caeni]MCU7548875.1 ATP-binding protein [Paraflavisolibacter caeni]